MTDIVLVNMTTVLTDEQVSAVVPVLQTLFDRDFEPVWHTGLAFKVSALPSAVTAGSRVVVPVGYWPIYLMDRTDVPDAGGYHEDDPGAPPFGRVFVKDAMDDGESWTVDLTHEFLEIAGDPDTQTMVSLPSFMGKSGYGVCREVGDAVEADALGYQIDGVLVTDWCTPEYFFQTGYGAAPRGKYDFMGHLKDPAPALMPGGYLGVVDPDGQWGQVSNFRLDGQHSRRSTRKLSRIRRAIKKSRG